MTERDRFELDLAEALRAYAEEAPTQVHPTELARHFATAYPRVRTRFVPRRLGMNLRPAWVPVLLAGLLIATVGWMLIVGSQRDPTLPAVLPPGGPTATPSTTYTITSTDTYAAVSTGGDHTCAINTDGTLECWGSDLFGQATPPEGTYVAVSAGMTHTCAIRTDGTLACWGRDLDGLATPPDDGTYVAVSTGSWHTCAIRTDDTLACWGSDAGVVGAPSGTFSAVSAGQEHTCAIRTDGTLTCWGFDDGRRVDPPAGAFVSVDDFYECAVRSDGTLTCWAPDDMPTPPPGDYVAVVGDWGQPCAIRTDGTLTCWGLETVPPPPAGSYTALSTSLPDYEACAIRTDGKLTCWGGDWIAKTKPSGWMGPPTTLIPDMREVLLASEDPEIQRGTVVFGSSGSGCSITTPSTDFSVGDSIHVAANLERQVRTDEVLTFALSLDGDPLDEGDAASRTFDVPGDCVGGVLHWAYAAPPWSDLSAFPISWTTGHYRLVFSVGGTVVARGEFDVGPASMGYDA